MNALKNKFYLQSIAKRMIIVITVLSVLSNAAFVGSIFVIMRYQLFNKTKAGNEKDIQMIGKELDMFFEGIRNDSISVLVSETCQTLLSNSSEFLTSDTNTQYRRYKLMQETIMSTIAQRSIYNTIVFYDLQGNSYAADRLIVSEGNLKEQERRIQEFLETGDNEVVLPVHKSSWRLKKDAEYKDCLSYLRKVYNKEQGMLIGVIELEIPNSAVCELYGPVMESGSEIYLVDEDEIISSADSRMLYKDLREEDWYIKLGRSEWEAGMKVFWNRKNIYLMKEYEPLGWKIIDAVPTSTYMKDIQWFAFIDIMIGLLLFLANLYISRLMIVSITKPLSKITNTIVEIGKGDYNRRVSVKDGGEIGTLADEFNRMIEKTNTLMEQIVETEQEKRESELSLVQLQMTPHFFYNILESICGLIVLDDKRTAIHTISLLSGFYRGVLNKGKEIITIEKELEIAVSYLEIMKICHPGKFEYYVECPRDVKQNCINKLTLQPILENSIHHGFNQIASGGIITIRTVREGDKTIIEVCDNGRGMECNPLAPQCAGDVKEFHMESFGLKNTDERIKLYFGSDYGIVIVSQQTGTRIRIELPVTAL